MTIHVVLTWPWGQGSRTHLPLPMAPQEQCHQLPVPVHVVAHSIQGMVEIFHQPLRQNRHPFRVQRWILKERLGFLPLPKRREARLSLRSLEKLPTYLEQLAEHGEFHGGSPRNSLSLGHVTS